MNLGLSLDYRVIAALRRIIRAIDVHSRQLMERFGVTGPQLMALQELARLGQVPIGVLARNVHVSHPTMTGILDRLEKRGLVQRSRDNHDRRRMTVAATRDGLRVLEAAPSPLQDRFRSEFSRLEEWEQTQMLATLQRIAAMMAAEELEAAPLLATGGAVMASASPASSPSEAASEREVHEEREPAGASGMKKG